MNDNTKYPEEGETMDNNFGTADILTGRGLGLGGFGYGGYGQGYGRGADGAYSVGANAVRLEASGKAHAAGLENLLDQNQFSATNKNIVDGFSRASDARSSNVNRVADNQFRAELRSSDQVAASLAVTNDMRAEMAKCCCDTQKAIADAAKDAALCCCDAKLEAAKSHAAITATVLADGAKTRELIRGDALMAANAKITQLETINALSSHHGH